MPLNIVPAILGFNYEAHKAPAYITHPHQTSNAQLLQFNYLQYGNTVVLAIKVTSAVT